MEDKQPLLSIVITCFNYENYVVNAIDSVINQDCDWVEIIVVDDGSTDLSWSRICQYGPQINPVRKTNGGPLENSLVGYSKAKGKFIYFLDADDYLLIGSLEYLKNHLNPSISKVQFQLTPVDEKGKCIGVSFPKLDPNWTSADLIDTIASRGFYSTPPTSGNIYRRDVYEDLGDMTYERAIDGIAFLLAPYLGNVVSIDKPLAAYRIHGNNLTSFSSVSSIKIRSYVDRFNGRLRHLDRILRERGIRPDGFTARSDYFYIREALVMECVADGHRPSLRMARNYVKALKNEYKGTEKTSRFILIILLFIMPGPIRKITLEFRINPGKNHRIRSFIKGSFVSR